MSLAAPCSRKMYHEKLSSQYMPNQKVKIPNPRAQTTTTAITAALNSRRSGWLENRRLLKMLHLETSTAGGLEWEYSGFCVNGRFANQRAGDRQFPLHLIHTGHLYLLFRPLFFMFTGSVFHSESFA